MGGSNQNFRSTNMGELAHQVSSWAWIDVEGETRDRRKF